MAPQGIYRCAGDDAWVAISVRDDHDWARFRDALGDPPWMQDPELEALSVRIKHHDELDRHITAWSLELTPRQAAERLLAAGVPAAALLKTDDIYGEPHLEARGCFHELDHPVCGPNRFPGWPMRFSFLPAPYAGGAATLGQHNEEILRDVLGLSSDEVARLRAAGVIGETLNQ